MNFLLSCKCSAIPHGGKDVKCDVPALGVAEDGDLASEAGSASERVRARGRTAVEVSTDHMVHSRLGEDRQRAEHDQSEHEPVDGVGALLGAEDGQRPQHGEGREYDERDEVQKGEGVHADREIVHLLTLLVEERQLDIKVDRGVELAVGKVEDELAPAVLLQHVREDERPFDDRVTCLDLVKTHERDLFLRVQWTQ